MYTEEHLYSQRTALKIWSAMNLIWFSEKGMNPFSFRKSYVLNPSSSNTMQMWPWWSNQSSIRTQALQRHRGKLLHCSIRKLLSVSKVANFYLQVKYSQSFFVIKRIYPLKHVNFWHGCLTVAVNIFYDLQSHSCATSANKSTQGMLTCIFVNLNEPNLISDSESSLYIKPILCIYVYMSIYVFRTNFSVCTAPQPLHSELEKATMSIIDIFALVTYLKGKLINVSDIGLWDMGKKKRKKKVLSIFLDQYCDFLTHTCLYHFLEAFFFFWQYLQPPYICINETWQRCDAFLESFYMLCSS